MYHGMFKRWYHHLEIVRRRNHGFSVLAGLLLRWRWSLCAGVVREWRLPEGACVGSGGVQVEAEPVQSEPQMRDGVSLAWSGHDEVGLDRMQRGGDQLETQELEPQHCMLPSGIDPGSVSAFALPWHVQAMVPPP
eukprot:TRINITY_DN7888_c0_g2_i14.p3 TRINITY_DN7888_c0_g2~~TRINITY_DN7888_c0_g2_i14.p3  ORF type:complete len:135 (+),score=16.73 TRINITY_DN7888_c0_g2_i14:247-651(+)